MIVYFMLFCVNIRISFFILFIWCSVFIWCVHKLCKTGGF